MIWIGILTPKIEKRDRRTKSALGFMPKKPAAYNHKIIRPLLSDLDKTVPTIEEVLKILQNAGGGKYITNFRSTIRKSKKNIQKLKKRPFNLIETSEQIENEIKATHKFLEVMNTEIQKINQEFDRFNFQEIVRTGMIISRELDLKTKFEPLPTIEEIKEEIIKILEISILVSLSAAFATFLDPLESVTRYPDSINRSFNEKDPYVIHFKNLSEIVKKILEKSQRILF